MSATPETDLNSPEHRLLLLLSLIELDDDQRAFARRLCAQIRDWSGVFSVAARRFGLPLTVRNLQAVGWPEPAAGLFPDLQGLVSRQARQNLMVAAELRQFAQTCLQPLHANYLIFKGIALCRSYYPDLGLRPCRDIDIAVEGGMLEPVIRRAITERYRLFAPNGKGGALTSAREIDALLRYARSAVLVSPGGIAIDLQPGIDKFSGIFDDYDVFRNLDGLEFGGLRYPVLKPAFLFNYICHHHARHLWSRLHWLSDLDALLRSPNLDLAEVRALADRFGQRGAVEAALEFHQLAPRPVPWDLSRRTHGHAYLTLCLQSLGGGDGQEKRMAMGLIGGEFMFRWQASDLLRRRARRNWLRTMLAPSYHQYQAVPLPRALQWVYYPFRVAHLAAGGVRRRWQGSR